MSDKPFPLPVPLHSRPFVIWGALVAVYHTAMLISPLRRHHFLCPVRLCRLHCCRGGVLLRKLVMRAPDYYDGDDDA